MTLTTHTIQISSIVYLFVLALTYGLYFSTSFDCLHYLVYKNLRRRERENIAMLTISTVLFLLQTAALAVNFKAALAVQNFDHKGYNTLNAVFATLQFPVLLITNGILIYRCWVIYGYSWKIIYLPVLFWISIIPLSVYGIYVYVLELSGVTDRLLSRASQVSTGVSACNIVTDVYTATAIVYRIVSVTRMTGRSGYLHQTWRIVAESGALHTISSILGLIGNTLFSKNPDSVPYTILQAVFDAFDVNMASIAFNLILIRVYQQREQRAMREDMPMSSDSLSSVIREVNSRQSMSRGVQHTWT
ncbi:hypothetical protein AX15_002052 [Amanita polypyramis BW_CC]|nr:hypothetical protein AX15_002052 [Amanita polypyramis BW_CC]